MYVPMLHFILGNCEIHFTAYKFVQIEFSVSWCCVPVSA